MSARHADCLAYPCWSSLGLGAGAHLPGFPCKVLSPRSVLSSSPRSHMHSPLLRSGSDSHPLGGRVVQKLLRVLLHKRFVCFLLFIYSVIYLCQYGLMNIYSILWLIMQCYSVLFKWHTWFFLPWFISIPQNLFWDHLIPWDFDRQSSWNRF